MVRPREQQDSPHSRPEGSVRIPREALPVGGKPDFDDYDSLSGESGYSNPLERVHELAAQSDPSASERASEIRAREAAFQRDLLREARVRMVMDERGLKDKGRKITAERKSFESAPGNFAKRTQRDVALHAQESDLREINTQISDLLQAQKEQRQDFWSFLPAKRRVIAVLDREIGELRTRERIARMRIAELTGEYHSDLAQNIPESKLSEIEEEDPARVALKTAFAEIGKELKPLAPWRASEQAGDVGLSGELTISQGTISALYKERAQLQAEKEGLMMFLRPFRRNTIELRLQQIGQEVDRLQEKIRTRDIKKKYSQSAAP